MRCGRFNLDISVYIKLYYIKARNKGIATPARFTYLLGPTALLELALALALVAVAADVPVPICPVVVALPPEIKLVWVTVTGTLLPLTAGSVERVVQTPLGSGQVPERLRFLSRGPVGPSSYFQLMFACRKFTCRGSLSGYCLSPQWPK
jgi:hypothetical protein